MALTLSSSSEGVLNTGGGQALCLAKLLEPDGSKLDPTVPTEIPDRVGFSWAQ